ncbi:MAG: DUF5723 family protein [Cellvibrionaceae bacterium]|nr:DUF5723 family protein [Cellvibrionaceae bacterium]
MIKRILGVLSITMAGPVAAADDWRVFTRAESFSYSEANPVTAFIDFLVGPAPEDGELAFTRNLIESGVGYKNVEFSLIHRNDYNLYFSRGASQFAYLNKNRKTIPYGQRYDVDVWGNQYQVSGAKFGFTLPFGKSVDVHVAYSHLYGTEAVSGYLGKDPNGEGGYISMIAVQEGNNTVRRLDGDLYTDYFFTDDPLFRNSVDAPTGRGYAVDLGFTWKMSDRLTLDVMVLDLAGELRWKNMPHIVAEATSENFQTDPDGVVSVVPNFRGTETYDDFTQDLTRRTSADLTYIYNQFVFAYSHDRMSRSEFNRVSAGYLWGEHRKWGLHLAGDVTTAAVELRLAMPVGDLYFTTDDLDIDNAHTLGFGWNLNFRF